MGRGSWFWYPCYTPEGLGSGFLAIRQSAMAADLRRRYRSFADPTTLNAGSAFSPWQTAGRAPSAVQQPDTAGTAYTGPGRSWQRRWLHRARQGRGQPHELGMDVQDHGPRAGACPVGVHELPDQGVEDGVQYGVGHEASSLGGARTVACLALPVNPYPSLNTRKS
jgi:hypothetical protein